MLWYFYVPVSPSPTSPRENKTHHHITRLILHWQSIDCGRVSPLWACKKSGHCPFAFSMPNLEDHAWSYTFSTFLERPNSQLGKLNCTMAILMQVSRVFVHQPHQRVRLWKHFRMWRPNLNHIWPIGQIFWIPTLSTRFYLQEKHVQTKTAAKAHCSKRTVPSFGIFGCATQRPLDEHDQWVWCVHFKRLDRPPGSSCLCRGGAHLPGRLGEIWRFTHDLPGVLRRSWFRGLINEQPIRS